MVEINFHDIAGLLGTIPGYILLAAVAGIIISAPLFFWGTPRAGLQSPRRKIGARLGTVSILSLVPGIMWAITETQNQQDAGLDKLREAYGIDHIDTIGNASLTDRINSPGSREATAITLTTDDGRTFEQARLVYHDVNPDAEVGEPTHSISVEVLDEPMSDWVPLEDADGAESTDLNDD